MEAPGVKGAPLAQTLAWAKAMGQQQVACMVVMVDHLELALLEAWITTSWLSGCLRACSVSGDTSASVLWGGAVRGACEHFHI